MQGHFPVGHLENSCPKEIPDLAEAQLMGFVAQGDERFYPVRVPKPCGECIAISIYRWEIFGAAVIFDSLTSSCGKELNRD